MRGIRLLRGGSKEVSSPGNHPLRGHPVVVSMTVGFVTICSLDHGVLTRFHHTRKFLRNSRLLCQSSTTIDARVHSEWVHRSSLTKPLEFRSFQVMDLDLSSLQSVRSFASAWGTRPLHLLVNNAGIFAMAGLYQTRLRVLQMSVAVTVMYSFYKQDVFWTPPTLPHRPSAPSALPPSLTFPPPLPIGWRYRAAEGDC